MKLFESITRAINIETHVLGFINGFAFTVFVGAPVVFVVSSPRQLRSDLALGFLWTLSLLVTGSRWANRIEFSSKGLRIDPRSLEITAKKSNGSET